MRRLNLIAPAVGLLALAAPAAASAAMAYITTPRAGTIVVRDHHLSLHSVSRGVVM